MKARPCYGLISRKKSGFGPRLTLAQLPTLATPRQSGLLRLGLDWRVNPVTPAGQVRRNVFPLRLKPSMAAGAGAGRLITTGMPLADGPPKAAISALDNAPARIWMLFTT